MCSFTLLINVFFSFFDLLTFFFFFLTFVCNVFPKDLEDRIEPEDMFNSTFSKKLLEILRQPYDKNEFKQRLFEASQKKQLTRSRQLRDGREIEYNVDHQLGHSYFDRYPGNLTNL